MVIFWTDFIAGSIENIIEFAFYIALDFRFATAVSCKEDGACGSFCSLNPFRMIMGNFR